MTVSLPVTTRPSKQVWRLSLLQALFWIAPESTFYLRTRTFRITQFINLPWLNNPTLIRLAIVPFRVDPVEIPILLGLDVPTFADVDKEYQNALNYGAKSVLPPTTEPWGQRTCYVADPDGNLIEIGSFVE